MTYRTGIGYDLHRLAAGRRLVLGGVDVPHEKGFVAHSDGDVVLHALCDALLGAAALGDIGELFPDTEPQWRDADSRQFVQEALRRVQAAGLAVENADILIHAQKPKLSALKPRICEAIAALLGVAPARVSVKAKTNEGVDAVGREEAIACWATVLLRANDEPGQDPR
ncbi:MAG: 2-C-methyl-D-erythritol 2,4-cyclodiphosphate synthase [Phycisphaerae bacterium]